MIENEPPLNNTDEMINNFIEECEREAAKLEITVDYYIAEFIAECEIEAAKLEITVDYYLAEFV